MIQPAAPTAVPEPMAEKTERISAVVPAYNEERSIGDVVRTLRAHPAIDEVIVVSDGSEDATATEARAAGAFVVELPENRGKGAALRTGAAVSHGNVLLFLDADLIGLTHQHIDQLLEAVVAHDSDMTVGVFDRGRGPTDLAQAIAPTLSGQRVVRKEVLDQVVDLEASGYGAEVALTRHMKRHRYRITEVTLAEMSHHTKEEKRGLMKGFAARMRMYWEIVKYLAD
ncbi:MAG: glycosyltransferase family 2 protein [Sulfobacillus sp.]